MNKKLEKICQFNEIMAHHTTFKIGGVVAYFFEPTNVKELKSIIIFCKKNGVRYEVIGNGSNILFSSFGFNGAIIKIGAKFRINYKKYLSIFKKIYAFINRKKTNRIFFSGGISLAYIANNCQKNGLSGIEFAVSIPGTFGGGITMNAGAFGGQLSDILSKVLVFNTKTNKIFWLPANDCFFSYRKSIFQTNPHFIILGAFLSLCCCENEYILKKMTRIKLLRNETQNITYPSAGSVFKRTSNFIPAKFFDEQGFKGLSVGDAQLSTVHSGYIVNLGSATSEDVLKLIKLLSEKVLQLQNYVLKLEIKLIGDF